MAELAKARSMQPYIILYIAVLAFEQVLIISLRNLKLRFLEYFACVHKEETLRYEVLQKISDCRMMSVSY